MGHMVQIVAFRLGFGVQKLCYKRKTPLVLGGTRTQVIADSMAIAASALNHCAT